MAEKAEENPEQENRDEQENQADTKIDYESSARAEGWKSKEELGSEFDAAKYVDAEEFIKRKPLFETIKSQNKMIKELKKTVDSVVNFTQKNAELAAKKAIAELKAQKKEAIKIGDVDSVDIIEKNIKDHEHIIDEAKAKKDEVPSEISEWVGKNQWFDDDPKMQKWAISFAKAYGDENPGEPMDRVLQETADAVKSRFSDSKYFKPKTTTVSPVETHRDDGGNEGRGKKNYSVSRLNEEQKLTYNAYVKKSKIMTHDEYFQKLEEIGALE